MAFRHHFPFSLYWHLLWWCKAMVSWYSKVMAPTLLGVTVFFTTKHHCPLPKPVSCKKVLHSFIKSWSWVYILNILGGKMRNAQKSTSATYFEVQWLSQGETLVIQLKAERHFSWKTDQHTMVIQTWIWIVGFYIRTSFKKPLLVKFWYGIEYS